jgi:prepilin-type N-terminal cleavage/methylation domain-containing protein
MNRRPGVTLIEVLVAIFVVAIGLLALLTLFPLGALSMAQAIKDDRIALMASNAVATIRTMDVASDANVQAAMTQNNPGGYAPDTPSYAALFDPVGYNSYAGVAQTQVGSVAGIMRCSSSALQAYPQPGRTAIIHGWFTSLDDLAFTSDASAVSNNLGVPADDQGQEARLSNGQVQRDGRYTWGAMLRRPLWGEPVTEVAIVVYAGRSTNLSANLAPAGETGPPTISVTAAPFPGNIITVSFGTATLDIRPGAWILDATNLPGHGYFYRVTGVTVNGNSADLELETPLRTPNCNQVILMDNVAEVIEKGVIAP